MQLDNKLYDAFKWIAMIFLPATSAAYYSLSFILPLPATAEVVGTIAVLVTFIGAILGFSTQSYNKSDTKYDGVMTVDSTDPKKDVFSFDLREDPESFLEKESLTFKVSKTSP